MCFLGIYPLYSIKRKKCNKLNPRSEMERGIFYTNSTLNIKVPSILLQTLCTTFFLTSTAFVSTNTKKYGIPLSRYTVFLQNCPLEHYSKDSVFVLYFHFCCVRSVIGRNDRRNVGGHDLKVTRHEDIIYFSIGSIRGEAQSLTLKFDCRIDHLLVNWR